MNKIFKFFCNALPLICSITACIYISLGGTPLFIVDASSSFHFSLITVNALFGGFLYTNYSLLLGVLDNPIIEKVKNTNIIHKRNSHILKGITYATISVIAGLYLILAPVNNSKFWKLIYCFMQNAEIIFMFFLIIFFLLSLKEMNIIISSIHNNKNAMSKQEIQDFRNKITSLKK